MHGGKAYGRDFRSHLRYSVEHLGITEFLADPDIWMRPAIKSNYWEHYDCALLHVEDGLVASDGAIPLFETKL